MIPTSRLILKTLKEQYGIDPKKSLLVPAASLDSLALPLKRLDERSKNRFFKLQVEGKLN